MVQHYAKKVNEEGLPILNEKGESVVQPRAAKESRKKIYKRRQLSTKRK